jgi:hypothetical protein
MRHGEGRMRWLATREEYTGNWEKGVQVGTARSLLTPGPPAGAVWERVLWEAAVQALFCWEMRSTAHGRQLHFTSFLFFLR